MAQTLTIAIPTHNRASVFAVALQSLHALQVPKNVELELVVIADACTDETAELVRGTTLAFPIRLFEENYRNLNLGRNKCVTAARGRHVCQKMVSTLCVFG
jgi:glucosyl-dolichyl phosphate glucuronosyltransferase